MKLSDLGEFGFIDRIAPGCETGEGDHVIQGIGDDASVVRTPDGVLVITTDMLIERVHFVRGTIEPRQLGHRVLAVNLSDIAAMGATPRDAYISIAVPPDVLVEELEEFFAGLKKLAAATGVNLLGGDTTRSPNDLCINVVVAGFADEHHVMYRSGARQGDRILVTGTLGDSAGGLVAMQEQPRLDTSTRLHLVEAHLEPELYLEEARILAESGAVGAAIDLSDGLASDLGHVCRRSGVGAVVDGGAIPLSDQLL
jgi:thiamine-monophosphate kinase